MKDDTIDGTASGRDGALRDRLDALYARGRQISAHFEATVRAHTFHPFVAADYASVEASLREVYRPGLRFLEWGSGTGTITIIADLLGFEAYGIEIDPDLVAIARRLAREFDSGARFAAGSLIPAGYRWVSSTGDPRLGTLGEGEPAYPELGLELPDFDIIFAYPWSGEEPIMHDIVIRRARPDARLLMNFTKGVRIYRAGVEC